MTGTPRAMRRPPSGAPHRYGALASQSARKAARHFFCTMGRARTLQEAIRFHGGEGSRSRAAFSALSAQQQERVLTYLRSL